MFLCLRNVRGGGNFPNWVIKSLFASPWVDVGDLQNSLGAHVKLVAPRIHQKLSAPNAVDGRGPSAVSRPSKFSESLVH